MVFDAAPSWVAPLTLTLPPAWLPADGPVAERFAAGLSGPGADGADAVQATPIVLDGVVGGSRVRAAILATASRPLSEVSTDTLSEVFRRAYPDVVMVTPIELPLGSSLRVRTRIRLDAEHPEQAIVQYVTPVLGRCRAVLSLVTGDLTFESELVETFDAAVLGLATPVAA